MVAEVSQATRDPEPYGIGLAGKSTGNHGFYHEIWGGPVIFPLKNPLNIAWVFLISWLSSWLSSWFLPIFGIRSLHREGGWWTPLDAGQVLSWCAAVLHLQLVWAPSCQLWPGKNGTFQRPHGLWISVTPVANPQRSGFIKLWKTPSCDPVLTIRGHEDRRSLGKSQRESLTRSFVMQKNAKNTSF